MDAPWGRIADDRHGYIASLPPPIKLGLMGGSGSGKVSKLAALAKARKEKKQAEEAMAAETAAAGVKEKTSISLLLRLSHKSSVSSVASSGSSTPSDVRTPILPATSAVPVGQTLLTKDIVLKRPTKSPNLPQGLDQPQPTGDEKPAISAFSDDEAPALKAVPSNFAESMFGPRLGFEAGFIWADTKTFDVLTGKEATKIKKAFSEPSPDDVVEAAQKGMGGAKG